MLASRRSTPTHFPKVFTCDSRGPSWWHDHSNGSSRSAATAAATSNALGPCRRCLHQRQLCSGDADVHRGQTSHPAGGTGWTWSSRHTAWRVGRSRTAVHHSCRAGLAGSKVPRVSRGRRSPFVVGGERRLRRASWSRAWLGLQSRKQPSEKRSELACNVPSASPTLVVRVSAAPDSSLEELEKIGLSGRWQSAWAAPRALEAHSRVEPVVGDSRARNSAGTRRAALESRGLITGMLETRFCWRRQGTMACGRRS